MFGFAPGQNMHVQVVVQGCRGCHRVALVLFCQLRKGVVGLCVDDGPLFNPANLVLLSFHPEKTAVTFEHLERLPVHHLGHAC